MAEETPNQKKSPVKGLTKGARLDMTPYFNPAILGKRPERFR